MADDDAATSNRAVSARSGRNAALTVGGVGAVVAVAAGFLVHDQRMQLLLVGMGLAAAAIWIPLAFVLEHAIAAVPPPRPSAKQSRPSRPAVPPWAYFVMIAFGVAGAGAGVRLVGPQASAAVGTVAQLTAAAVGCGFFLLTYLLISRWWRARRSPDVRR